MNGMVILLAAALSAGWDASQLQLAEIRAVVVDDSAAVLPGAAIELTDPLGAVVASRHSDSAGRFVIANVAPGRYVLVIRFAGFETSRRQLTVASALPLELTIKLPVHAALEVIVDEAREPDSPATRVAIAGSSIEQVPVRNAAKGVQEVVATLPGWSTEDNGLLHSRGTDDGFLYVVDGIPVYERLDQLSGIAPDTSSIETINVMTGYLPAEYGYKSGGVIDVRSKGVDTGVGGALTVDTGSENTSALSGAVGGRLSQRATFTLGTALQRSDRFLDPVHPDNFHNSGDAASGSASATWTLPDRMIATLAAGGGRSDYEVPNTEEQQATGQDQRQRIEQWFGTANWQHVWSRSLNSQLAGYLRRSAADLTGSSADTPLFANASRSLRRIGAIGGITWNVGAHTVKAGADMQRLSLRESFQFAVTDADAAIDAGFSDAVLDFVEDDPFHFEGESTQTLFSAYVQDDWQTAAGLTIAGGLRVDRSALLLPRVQISPRIGLTYRIDRTVLRGSVSRFFQPPQPEYLLLSSSPQARVLSPFAEEDTGGGADIEPERQWAFEAGANHEITQWARIDGAFWYRSIVDAADPNVFAGTTVIFPNAVAGGRAYGLDLRAEFRRQSTWSGYASASTARVRQRGPITGGLFLEQEIAEIAEGEEFVPDHDQAVVASGGVTWTHPARGASFSFALRYESGTPIGDVDEDDDLPGAELVDFERGRVKPRTIASLQTQVPVFRRRKFSTAVRFTVQNIFGTDYAYNFGNPFSGTHFGAPRTFSVGVRAAF